ncbi:MAG: hypothetical protein J7K21_05875 [Desulfurococcales archaeon]|nr:hypothetical protein [Desulfurococcales archaeon]
MLSKEKIMLLVVEGTAPPLLLLTILMMLSGYGIVGSRTLSALTGGLFGYRTSLFIHTDSLIRYSFSILALIHSYSGFSLMILRRVRHSMLRNIIEYIVFILIVYIGIIVSIIEFT